MSRKREGRGAVNLWLPMELVDKVDSRIPELGRDRTQVIEVILSRFWNAKMEIMDGGNGAQK